jgi:hypothetical protein
MDTGKAPVMLHLTLEPMDDRPLVPVFLERAAADYLYCEITHITDDLEFVITI